MLSNLLKYSYKLLESEIRIYKSINYNLDEFIVKIFLPSETSVFSWQSKIFFVYSSETETFPS